MAWQSKPKSPRRLPGLRWWIIGLVFLATLINYIDRLTVSVLAPLIMTDLGLSNLEYASLGTWFLLAYTISQGLSGRMYDRIGTRLGFTISVTVWSIAATMHAFARGLGSLSLFRFLLGLGEAGNWPGAAKTVAEWFPIRERAFGMAIFNSGAALGSVVAPPLIVYLQSRLGWQMTFIVTGMLGFGWLGLWLLFYRAPDRHPWLGESEYRLIHEGRPAGAAPLPWRNLLGYRQVWAILIARLFVDPVWWLYITWLPLFLYKVHGFDLKKIGLFAWVPYVAADAGSLLGGWTSGYLIRRGWSVDRARRTTIIIAAALMPAGIFAARTPDPLRALALIAVVLFGFQFWINNVQTLPSDLFPERAVASVAGLGGVGAGIGSMIFVLTTGWVADRFSYTPILTAAGLLAPLGTILLLGLIGQISPVEIPPPVAGRQ
ncbi:MAG: MFS transporter [Acidobacteriota bacterium]